MCLGVLMSAVTATAVNVAIPSMKEDLHLADVTLAWVVDAYLVAFGGFLLVGARLGDLYGRHRLFMVGVTLFTIASLVCGISTSAETFVGARFGQGVGAALLSSVSLSQITALFPEASARAKAQGLYVFCSAGGGSIGLLVGGVLSTVLDWHWIFFVNVPFGVGVFALSCALMPPLDRPAMGVRVNVLDALTGTMALMLAVYGIISARDGHWYSMQTLVSVLAAVALCAFFIMAQNRAITPLLPLALFGLRSIRQASVAAMLLAAAIFTWNFVVAIYLQTVLQLTPLQVGLAFLPANVTTALVSLLVAPGAVIRWGFNRPLTVGIVIVALGLLLLARNPVSASMWDVAPGMVLVGIGTGMAYNPLSLSALSSVAPRDVGAASGLISTCFAVGGALGLSVLANVGQTRMNQLLGAGAGVAAARAGGYRMALWSAALLAAVAAIVSDGPVRKADTDV
jgi:EmrB/QacA subfamily drug resistance transporter